ncbi:MAG: Asp-tRNA(Asn)/Glu-tRNA(Gln) amidotransferase subunit GatA [Candidatus Paceibacterota bacterium]
MALDLEKMTIASARAALAGGEISARELTEAYLTKAKAVNDNLHCYLELFADCLDQADEMDRSGVARSDKPLAGIPLAVKDNILIKGRQASAGSRMLANYQAPYEATVITKLKEAGAIFVGRTNMDEFAMGSSTETSAFGPTRNPHDQSRVPGGSSGGSAAAVAAGAALAALGSDTGGSIRQPAGFCGVVGLKPTYGAVSRYGLMAMASSLDQIGPISQTVLDAEVIFRTMVGRDDLDSTTADYPSPAKKTGRTIGIPEGFLAAGLDPAVNDNFRQTVKDLTAAGCDIREIELPHIKYALASYYIIMPAEVSSNLARFDGVKYGLKVDGDNLLADYLKTRQAGFGTEVRRRILLGTYVLSAGYYDAYYAKAAGVRGLIRRDYEEAFASGIDAVLTPTAPTPAFPLGEKTADPLQMYLEDIFTVPANLAGLPAMAVPSGKTEAGLPLSVQFIAPHFREDTLFDLGRLVEDITANQEKK